VISSVTYLEHGHPPML